EEEKLDPLMTRIVKIDYGDLTALRDNLEKYLLASKKDIDKKKVTGKDEKKATEDTELRGSILMDASTNSLIIQATKSDIQRIMPIIQQLDRPSHQILIEAHIVEANSDTAKELGIQWGGLGLATSGSKNNTWLGGPLGTFDKSLLVSSDDATATVPAGTAITHLPNIGTGVNFPSSENAGTTGWKGMTIGLMNQNIGDYLLYAQLTALEEEGKLNILSKPSITTMDHRKATIESGKEVPFQTVEDNEVKIEFKKAVIKLEVTPHVINNKIIRLEILTHKDELDWTRTVAGNPTIITKNAQTNVNLYDGQTTVIGGLNKEKLQENEAGIPWLKDLPGIGMLFRNNTNAAEMEELLIFITPHILKGQSPKPEK
ncbi:MAG: type IV pilus secretin PilQ, partial [Proteobacteria bacterium]|nr:type IV pilus secretin PilQ [Pseudomonadota bacterium]MBU1583766.1 type IV pilus secretin PilQ [Pseudomonadota bacterium]